MKKETLVQLIIIAILTVMLVGLLFVTVSSMNSRNFRIFGRNLLEEEKVKDTKKEDIDTGEKVNLETIKLDEYDSNITIEEGEKGAFKIANTRGTNYGNQGFMWVSYDTLNIISSVSEFNFFVIH